MEDARFDHLGVFGYSDEDSSASYHLDKKVSARTIYQRKRHLMSIQRKVSRLRNRALAGRELPVLIEGRSKQSELVWEARLATQAPEIDGVCYISDPGEPSRARASSAASGSRRPTTMTWWGHWWTHRIPFGFWRGVDDERPNRFRDSGWFGCGPHAAARGTWARWRRC